MKFWLSLATLLTLALAAQASVQTHGEILSHQLELRLEPETHWLSGRDRIVARPRGDRLVLALHPELILGQALLQEQRLPFRRTTSEEVGRADGFALWEIGLPEGTTGHPELLLLYAGEIYDPVQASGHLAHVRGGDTRGLIGPEGVYLDGGTGFLPMGSEETTIFQRVQVDLPVGWTAITQGDRLREWSRDGRSLAEYGSKLPFDSLAVVANRFVVERRQVGELEIGTAFFEEDAGLSGMFLDALARDVALYAELLGPCPFNRFDIVENFYQTGYGFPAFTLLGDRVIQQGPRALRPGHIDHEYVHNWWGNSVYPDYPQGNWCEGITSYCSNYYKQEISEDPGAAPHWRSRVSQKFAIRVRGDRDYPIREFIGKEEAADDQIGYGKAAMVFHMLRRRIGDEAFWGALRGLAVDRRGRVTGWVDFQQAFEKKSGEKLDWFFQQWLDRTGGPELQLRNLRLSRSGDSFRLEGEVHQRGEPYRLRVPIRVETETGARDLLLDLDGNTAPFLVEGHERPVRVVLDPERHLFHRLPPESAPPCLNWTLEAPAGRVSLPEAGVEEIPTAYRTLADRITGSTALEEAAGPNEGALLLLGAPDGRTAWSEVAAWLPEGIELGSTGFTVGGQEYTEAGDALLVSFRAGPAGQRPVTVFYGLSPEALSRARLLFFYGWDGWIAFRSGRPADRGDLTAPTDRLAADLGAFLAEPPLEEQRIIDGIRPKRLGRSIWTLADPAMEGRLTGQPGADRARAWVGDQFQELELEFLPGEESYEIPFHFTVQEVHSPPELAVLRAGAEKLEPLPGEALCPMYGSRSGVFETDRIVWIQDPQGELGRMGGAMVLTPAPTLPASPHALARAGREWAALVHRLVEAGAGAVILVAQGDEPVCPLTVFPSMPPSGRYGPPSPGGESALVAAAGGQGLRGPELDLGVPAVMVRRGDLSGLDQEIAGQARPVIRLLGWSRARLEVRMKSMNFRGANMAGLLRGGDPDLAAEWIVLGAHHDHLGSDAQGEVCPGADDNASGVAALVETARLLVEEKEFLARSVVFVTFSGEEMGLRGSRAFAARAWPEGARPMAMINLDTVGGIAGDRLHLIGAWRSPELHDLFDAVGHRTGLPFHADLEFAYKLGSDHYAFHEQGIPAVDLCSGLNRTHHSPQDTPDRIDLPLLARVTRSTALATFRLAGGTVPVRPIREIHVPYPRRSGGHPGGGSPKPEEPPAEDGG